MKILKICGKLLIGEFFLLTILILLGVCLTFKNNIVTVISKDLGASGLTQILKIEILHYKYSI